MYQKPTLSLSQIRSAMNAMLDQAQQEPDRPAWPSPSWTPTPRCSATPVWTTAAPFRSAWPSARLTPPPCPAPTPTTTPSASRTMARNIADFGDSQLVAVQGAVVVRDPETDLVLGAIGVSGLSAQEDEDLARLGLNALGL